MATILGRLQSGDILSFKKDNRISRFRKVLGVAGDAVLLSSAAKEKTGNSLNKYFVTLTPSELEKNGYQVAA